MGDLIGEIILIVGYVYLKTHQITNRVPFILMQDRPIWKGQDDDFPHGGRPTDIITQDRRDKIQAGEFDWTEIENVIPQK